MLLKPLTKPLEAVYRDILDLNSIILPLDFWKKYVFKRATHEKIDVGRKASDQVRKSLQAKGWLHVENPAFLQIHQIPYLKLRDTR